MRVGETRGFCVGSEGRFGTRALRFLRSPSRFLRQPMPSLCYSKGPAKVKAGTNLVKHKQMEQSNQEGMEHKVCGILKRNKV